MVTPCCTMHCHIRYSSLLLYGSKRLCIGHTPRKRRTLQVPSRYLSWKFSYLMISSWIFSHLIFSCHGHVWPVRNLRTSSARQPTGSALAQTFSARFARRVVLIELFCVGAPHFFCPVLHGPSMSSSSRRGGQTSRCRTSPAEGPHPIPSPQPPVPAPSPQTIINNY